LFSNLYCSAVSIVKQILSLAKSASCDSSTLIFSAAIFYSQRPSFESVHIRLCDYGGQQKIDGKKIQPKSSEEFADYPSKIRHLTDIAQIGLTDGYRAQILGYLASVFGLNCEQIKSQGLFGALWSGRMEGEFPKVSPN